MKQITQPIPDAVWNTIAGGLDTLLRTHGLQAMQQVAEANYFLANFSADVAEEVPGAANDPVATRAAAKKKS